MRPKVVILILVAAFGVLGIIALFKGVAGRSANGGGEQASVTSPTPATNPADSTNQKMLVTGGSNAVAMSEDLRAAVIAKEEEEIQDLQGQVDGTNNLIIITAIIDKLSNPEAEVRKAALQALRELNDTNAVPGLQKAADSMTDPREKVAVLDAIDYIKMPSVMQNVPPEYATNFPNSTVVATNIQFNPAFLKGMKSPRVRNNGQQAAPPNTPANQPQ